MSFNILKKSEKVFKKANYFKARDLSILDFQIRLLDLAKLDETPIMEKLNFVKIIISNLEEFISVKFQDIRDNEVNAIIFSLESMYRDIADVISILNQMFGYTDSEDEIYIIISNNDIQLIYSGETNTFREYEINNKLKIRNNMKCNVALYYGKLESLDIADYTIHVPKEILLIDKYINFYKNYLKNYNDLYYTNEFVMYEEYNYYNELQKRDMLFRVPYDSYQMILDFIDQMCTNENITTIFISLYRTANNSKIINSLIKAKTLGKSVFVYVEPTARGNEIQNIEMINKMRDVGIYVKSSYFDYKIHSKIFCAIDKFHRKYVHVGTGNYNENTAKIYTDTHLLSSNDYTATNVLNIFVSIFSNINIQNFIYNKSIQTSPLNFRNTFNELIETEINKGVNGRIFIKCNNLCDFDIIKRLYKAANAGVQIKIICRTGCSIRTKENIQIRSKVGKYLEHDRIYSFGDRVFISSADLLLRNISKRVETICEITDHSCKHKLFRLMESLFNDPLIHHMTSDGKWELK